MIEIMKASAGSGKTYNLAKNYIHILLQKKAVSNAYRHILAVTFTNKATDEMKTRILKELYVLATYPDRSDFRKYFLPGPEQLDKPAVCKDEDELKREAGLCLNAILHDYSSFSVSTIDKFFQKTLKSFAREIGQFASYKIELDRDSMIEESVDRFLDAITPDDKDLLDWLTEGAMNDLSEGRKYNMEARLVDVAKRIMHFSHSDLAEKLRIDEAKAYSKAEIGRIEKLCSDVAETFARDIRTTAGELVKTLTDLGYDASDFRANFYGGLAKLKDFRKGDKFDPSATLLDCMSGEKELFIVSDEKAGDKKAAIGTSLDGGFAKILALNGTPLTEYNTALRILSSLHDLGVAAELRKEFDALSKEKNIMSLVESDAVLKDIINGSDAPFIYEKLGVRLENFLLDEFQDTSRVQWENMRPLLKESQSHESYHHISDEEEVKPYSLIVGDVKQSIYRWRGSDWNLLDNEVEREFEEAGAEIVNTVLQENYRSLRSIVSFNNGFFPYMAERLDKKLGCSSGLISGIYSTTEQQCRSSEVADGSVDITFAEKDSLFSKVKEAIEEVIARGAQPGDIAVLVRTNNLGSEIAGYLIENGISVVTNDSLSVKSSYVIRKVVACLTLLDNPDDKVAGYIAKGKVAAMPSYFHSIIDECSFFLRKIEEDEPGILAKHTLYIQSFMDIVQKYVASNGNNLRGFLEEWKENKSKISSPESKDAVKIITIHKAKGLEFPYVIYLYKPDNKELSIRPNEKFWCAPEGIAGTALSDLDGRIFDVHLTKSADNSMFRDDYRNELGKLFVDVINVAYVAFTRPSKGLHIITLNNSSDGLAPFLYEYVSKPDHGFAAVETGETQRYRLGELYDFAAAGKKNKKLILPSDAPMSIASPFRSYSPNPEMHEDEEGQPEQRLKFNADSTDFFAEDGSVGVGASARRKGTVLHNILASVEHVTDLGAAVATAVDSGDLTPDRGREAEALLKAAIQSVESYGWFSENTATVRNERALVDTDGCIYRPDRVIELDGRIIIVDYKFGEPKKYYRKQVSRYAGLYSRLGYKDVSAYIWYVFSENEPVDKVIGN